MTADTILELAQRTAFLAGQPVSVGELVTAEPMRYPVTETLADCPCGRPIVPGQLYVPNPRPRHLGCQP